MTEREEAIKLAIRILDRVNADPDGDLAVLSRQFLRADELAERTRAAHKIIVEQAEEGGLWFIAKYASEAYLQQELRRLHAAIEGKSPEDCAAQAIDG